MSRPVASIGERGDEVQEVPTIPDPTPEASDELVAEQAYVDHAYDCLERSRALAARLTSTVEVGQGGTEQARYEREVIYEHVLGRLSQLDLGDASLVFGRIDHRPDAGGDAFYIGRMGVWDEHQDPVVVDWRAPVSESFYRATASAPMGLERRRHFTSRGRVLLGIDDDVFADLDAFDEGRVSGQGALMAALEEGRTGRLGDIVGTIQHEQDEVIRAPLPGILVVQGGPGTGKTVVALHRAAYLLYTHRFPLDGQGVLVVGPNRLFLAYIEQVLPSLGEAGVDLSTTADLVPNVSVDGLDPEPVARLKGDPRMADVVRRAVRTRQQPLRHDLVVGYGITRLRLTVAESEAIVREARRRYRRHNAARRYVEAEVFAALADSGPDPLDPDTVRSRLREAPEVREALEWMWPVLTPAALLHDLYGSRALLRAAAGSLVDHDAIEALHRPRVAHPDDVVWTRADAPLLDEALAVLGPRPGRKRTDAVRTYGHIVVDEAQDLSPMELRVLRRRSLNGSMTLVGDIAQATGAWAHDQWDDVIEPLRQRHDARWTELTIGYRIPAPIMALASRVQAVAAPGLTPPRSVREQGQAPMIVTATDELGTRVVEVAAAELAQVDPGNVSIICPLSLVEKVEKALADAGVDYGRATRRGLDHRLSVVPVPLVKGLEVDSAIVVEPAAIVAEEMQGLRALYVSLTRATKRLTIVHAAELPDVLTGPA